MVQNTNVLSYHFSISFTLHNIMPTTNCVSLHSHVNGDPMDPSRMTKQQLLPGLDSQWGLEMLMMGVYI